jgi:hypothetical protein
MKKVKLLQAECSLEFGFYPNKTIAICAYVSSTGELWCVPTVNYEKCFEGIDYKNVFQFPCVVIKNYAENAGIYEELLQQKVITSGPYLSGTGGTVLVGVLTEEWQEIARRQLEIKPR